MNRADRTNGRNKTDTTMELMGGCGALCGATGGAVVMVMVMGGCVIGRRGRRVGWRMSGVGR